MGRCRYELLAPLEPALEDIRKIENIIEKKPGIFYYKSQSFLHFHEKDGAIWADLKSDEGWESIPIPKKVTKAFGRDFFKTIKNRADLKIKKAQQL